MYVYRILLFTLFLSQKYVLLCSIRMVFLYVCCAQLSSRATRESFRARNDTKIMMSE